MRNRFRESREGSSLAIVMCVSAFLTAFALAMLYTASLSLSRSGRRLEQEQSYQLARSFSEVLEEELYRYSRVNEPEEESRVSSGPAAPEGSFYRYVVGFLEGQYGAYDPDHPDETVFHFTAGEVSGDTDAGSYGRTVRVALYKEPEDTPLSETLLFEELETKLDDIETNPIYRYAVTVEVTVETENGVSFCCRTKYQQVVRYAVEYRCEDEILVRDDTPEKKWHIGTAAGPLFQGEGKTVQYSYKKGMENIQSCTFINILQKKGDAAP